MNLIVAPSQEVAARFIILHDIRGVWRAVWRKDGIQGFKDCCIYYTPEYREVKDLKYIERYAETHNIKTMKVEK